MTLCTSSMRRTSWSTSILIVVLLSNLKLLKESNGSSEKGKTFPDLRKTQILKCIPSNDQRNCSIDEQHTSNIFLSPYILWDMNPAALLSPNHTNYRVSLFNQYPQTTTQQHGTQLYPVFFLLRTMDIKRYWFTNDWFTNTKPNTDMCLYGHKIQTNSIKRKSMDQSACKNFGNLNHQYQKLKTVP